MVWRNIRQLLQGQLERDLSESKYIRRLAQLTVYQFFRLTQWGSQYGYRAGHTKLSTGEDLFQRFKVFSTYFRDNLHKELQNFQIPKEKDHKDSKSKE